MVGKRFLLNGVKVKVIGYTDSGNVKVAYGGIEDWVQHNSLIPMDGTTKGFKVLPIDGFTMIGLESNAKLAA